jgi:ribosomal-protein-alanine N-acetyltransferase
LNLKFREFKLRDLKEIIEIEKEAFPLPLSEVAMIFLSTCCRFYVVEDREIMGYLILGNESNDTLFIHHLAVKKKYRNRGIGSEFIKRYISNKKSVVTVRASNEKAVRFYERHGFRKIRTYKNLFNGKEDLILLGVQT